MADEPELTAAYRTARKEALRKFLHEEIDRERYQSTVNTFLTVFKDAPSHIAREQAIAEAERHLESGFRFPEYGDWSSGNFLERLADTYTD